MGLSRAKDQTQSYVKGCPMESHHAEMRTSLSLAEAAQRLDRALAALEGRIKGMGDDTDTSTRHFGSDSLMKADPAHVSMLEAQIQALRHRESVLEEAAQAAFELLGQAAANIRELLVEEAA